MAHGAIFFDAGHTLIEPNAAALSEAAAEAGMTGTANDISRAFRRAIAALNRSPTPSPLAFRELVASELAPLGVSTPETEEVFWAVLDRHNAERRLWTQPIEGAHAVLAALRERDFRIGV